VLQRVLLGMKTEREVVEMANKDEHSPTPGRTYSPFGRPFRLQLSAHSAAGFDAPASRGRCQIPGCSRFEWRNGAKYCRDCWLHVYQQTRLPDRLG
jgi:hypothetical protein